eukprot:m.288475 g.288475  ORF g.288475 m.288475 type:complete len:52 (-) comp11968_c0_seq1:80-235(-)
MRSPRRKISSTASLRNFIRTFTLIRSMLRVVLAGLEFYFAVEHGAPWLDLT